MRTCLTCGASLEGRRPTAKFCNDLHRAQHKRGHRPPETPEPTEVSEVRVIHGEPLDPPPTEPVLPTLTDVAWLLAQRLASPLTPPTASAGLAREYRATLAEIAAREPKAPDGIDEIAERRAKRGRGA